MRIDAVVYRASVEGVLLIVVAVLPPLFVDGEHMICVIVDSKRRRSSSKWLL